MAKPSPLMLIPLVVTSGFLILAAIGLTRANPGELPSAFVGQQAPPVPTQSLDGTSQLTDASLRSGEITIVNFWASWCPPCRVEHPTLQALADDGFRVAGINFGDTMDQATAYLADEGDPFFATGYDPARRDALNWGVSAPPETFIVDGDGTVLFRFTGPLIASDYEQRFLPALAAATAN